MTYKADTVEEYIAAIPDERKAAFLKLMETVRNSLPEGFEEGLSYGFPGFYVPRSLYPAGYHANPKEPLPFISMASQKNFIGFYHLGIYARPDILEWFETVYAERSVGKPDMGKSCIRFRKPEKIPYDLIGELCSRITVQEWITTYEKSLKRNAATDEEN